MENPIRMDHLGVPPTVNPGFFSPKEKVETKAGAPREVVVISFHLGGGGLFQWSFTLED